jgi:hypothetical protein
LEETHHAHDLDWLPAVVPPGLRLILSSLEGDTLDAARRKYPQRQDLIVTSLRLVDQGFIIARQLKAARKSLSTARDWRRQWRTRHGDPYRLTDPIARQQALDAERQQERSQLRFILTGVSMRHGEPTPEQTIERETANPLYLKLVAEELRLFGDYDRLAEFIAQLPTDVPGMFHAVLSRLEGDHGGELVEHALSLVATGRHGLLEGELLELLARPGEERFPMALWSRLYRGMAYYLKPRASIGGGDEGLIGFFHQQLAKAVRERYLRTDEVRLARHAELVGYFQRKGDPGADDTWKGSYPRSLSELVHHQIGGRLWDRLEKTLATLPFLEANVTADRTFDLASELSTAITALPTDRPQRRVLRLLDKALRRDIHFIARHAQDYPQGLFQCLWNSCWWYDCPGVAQHYVVPTRHLTAKRRIARWVADRASLLSRAFGLQSDEGESARAGSLYSLMERWRESRERASCGLPWLRSLRPPPIHLGTAQLAVLRGHEESVTSVAFSPGGDRIASGSRDQTVRVWDVQTGAELAILRGHEQAVSSVAFSPGGDRIASGSVDGTVRVWDAHGGEEVAILRGHKRVVTSVDFFPGGDRIASRSNDESVRVWDAHSGEELAVLRGPSSVAFSPDGDRVAIADGKYLGVWDAQSGAMLTQMYGHDAAVRSFAFSPGGDRIASGSDDNTVRVC